MAYHSTKTSMTRSMYRLDHLWIRQRVAQLLGYRESSKPFSRRQAGYATIADDTNTQRTNPFPYPTNQDPTPYQIFHLPLNASKQQIKSRYYELVRAHHPDSAYTAHLPPDEAHSNFRHIKASYDFLSGKTLSPHPNSRATQHDGSPFDPYAYELARRRRAYYASRSRQEQAEAERPAWAKGWGGLGAHPDERSDYDQNGWRERTIFLFGVMTLMAGLFPTLPSTLATVFLPTSFWSSESLVDSRQKKTPDNPPGTDPPYNIPFVDLDRGHRAAVSALIQAREECKETGAERRDQIKVRVAQMSVNREAESDAANALAPTPSSSMSKDIVVAASPPNVVSSNEAAVASSAPISKSHDDTPKSTPPSPGF